MPATNWTNITDFETLLQAGNANSPFWLGMLIMLYAVFLISFTSMANIMVGLLASSFVALILGIFLAYMGLVAWTWVMFIAGILLFTMLYVVFSKK